MAHSAFEKALLAMLIAGLMAFVATGAAVGVNDIKTTVEIHQEGGSLAGHDNTGSSSDPNTATASIDTLGNFKDPNKLSATVNNDVLQSKSLSQLASTMNNAKVTNDGCRPTTEAKLDFTNTVKQSASGNGATASSFEGNGFVASGNIKKLTIAGNNDHTGNIYGMASSETTNEFNRADFLLTGCSSKANVKLTNGLTDDPSELLDHQTNIVAGDIWDQFELYDAQASDINAGLKNKASSGAAVTNAQSQNNVGMLAGKWKNSLTMDNIDYQFPTGLGTEILSEQNNKGSTKGFDNYQWLHNTGTLLRAPAGTSTSSTTNDYQSFGWLNKIDAGTVVSIS